MNSQECISPHSSPSPALKSHPGAPLSSEEKYDYLAEYGTQILCLLNRDKQCTYLSRNFETITGHAKSTGMGGGFSRLILKEYHERLEALLATPSGHAPQPFRCQLKHADKKYYWYLFMIHAKPDSNEYVCIIENIHESILIQNNLQKARLEAELALSVRSEFLANMSHELRTPLNAVIGFAQIIENEIFGKIDHPQYKEYVRHIHESGYDLLAKIEDLLEIANIDAGRVTLTHEEVHLNDIFQHVVETQAHHAAGARVSLEVTPLPRDVLLYVDRLKLQHILGHLVANAIKFSPQGGKISLEAMLWHNGSIQLYVQDGGTGMLDIKLNAIVTALQEDNCWATANHNRSIGIGLALTREFVVLHGGQLEVNSKPGEGTTIVITLPKECIHNSSMRESDCVLQHSAH